MKSTVNAARPSHTGTAASRRGFLKYAGGLGLGLILAGCTGTNPVQAAGAQHHLAEGFRNPAGSPEQTAVWTDYVGHFWHHMWSANPKPPPGHSLTSKQAGEQLAAAAGRDSLTWLGHSAFLLRLEGRNLLLDPFLSEYATALPPFGPSRFCPPGLSVDQLPPIDAVIISHNHYDHMDMPTLEAVAKGGKTRAVVPLKVGQALKGLGFSQVSELDWGQSCQVGPLGVTALPAIHFSGRSLWDRNQTLWCSYAIASGDQRVFFAGDTAYGPVFKDMGQSHGPFDLALVPVGAYEPPKLMLPVHTTPEQAVILGRDMGAKALVPGHWGTIPLSNEPAFEPPLRFRRAGLAAGFQERDLWVMKVGETRTL